jgi:hypothetical protein
MGLLWGWRVGFGDFLLILPFVCPVLMVGDTHAFFLLEASERGHDKDIGGSSGVFYLFDMGKPGFLREGLLYSLVDTTTGLRCSCCLLFIIPFSAALLRSFGLFRYLT